MQVKIFEVRDRATFMPVIAVKPMAEGATVEHGVTADGWTRYSFGPPRDQEMWLLKRLGFEPSTNTAILITGRPVAQYDQYAWDSITMQTAHGYIEQHWDALSSGDLIDCEFIRGETQLPKVAAHLAEQQRAQGRLL